jgi:hypothetical protein
LVGDANPERRNLMHLFCFRFELLVSFLINHPTILGLIQIDKAGGTLLQRTPRTNNSTYIVDKCRGHKAVSATEEDEITKGHIGVAS